MVLGPQPTLRTVVSVVRASGPLLPRCLESASRGAARRSACCAGSWRPARWLPAARGMGDRVEQHEVVDGPAVAYLGRGHVRLGELARVFLALIAERVMLAIDGQGWRQHAQRGGRPGSAAGTPPRGAVRRSLPRTASPRARRSRVRRYAD